MTTPFSAASVRLWNCACICIMQLFREQKAKVISRRKNCFLGCIFDFMALCCSQTLQVCQPLLVQWLFTHCTFISWSSPNTALFLGAFFFTHFCKSLCTCDFRLWTALNINHLSALWFMIKHLFVPRRTFCLNAGIEGMTHKLTGKPFGLRREEGCIRAERSQLSFKTCTAFTFPYWLSALVGMSYHIFWASLYYVTQCDRDNLCDKSQKPVCQWRNRKLTVIWTVP